MASRRDLQSGLWSSIVLLVRGLLAASLLTGCSSGLFSGSDSTQNSPEDSGRPTDKSEGVPGYLTSPENVSVIRSLDGKTVTVAAPPGAVKANTGSVQDLLVRIAVIAADEMEAAGGDSVLLQALEAIKVDVQQDGSFSVRIDVNSGDYLAIAFGAYDDETSIEVDEENAQVTSFYDLGDDGFFQSFFETKSSTSTGDDFRAAGCMAQGRAYLQNLQTVQTFANACSDDSDCIAVEVPKVSKCDYKFYFSKTSHIYQTLKYDMDQAILDAEILCGSAGFTSCPLDPAPANGTGDAVCHPTKKICMDADKI